MAGNIRTRDIKRNIRAKKMAFLEAKGSLGGEKFEFINSVITDVDSVMVGVSKEDAFKEILAGFTSQVWEKKTKRDEDQLVIDGIELDQEIRFIDEDAPSGYRTVLSKHATIRHVAKSLELAIVEREFLDAKIREKEQAISAALERSGGDYDALISAHCDVKPSFREAAE